MPRFLLEVSHESDAKACVHVLEAFQRSGSHFLMRADWGCKDGDHKAWMVVDVATREEARSIVPSEFRQRTRVVGLHHFTPEEVAEMRRFHGV